MTIRVAFFTNATSTLSLPVLRALHETAELEVAHIFLFDTIAASRGRLWSVIKQHGLKKTMLKASEVLIKKVSSLLPCGGTQSPTIKTSHDYAASQGIPFSIVSSVNASDTVAAASELQCDLLVSCSFSQIMRQPILDTPKIAAVNIHPSLLPKYRGPLPSFWVLKHGETESGVTFHLMDAEIDNGNVIEQFSLPVERDWDEDELTNRLFAIAGNQVVGVLTRFVEGESIPYAQDESAASYYSFPTAADRKR